MAEELGLRKILGGEFNTLWWVDEASEPDVLRRYFTALARADEAIERDLERLSAALDEVHPPEFADRPWRVDTVGRRRAVRVRAYPADKLAESHGGDPPLGHGARDARHRVRPARAVARVSGARTQAVGGWAPPAEGRL